MTQYNQSIYNLPLQYLKNTESQLVLDWMPSPPQAVLYVVRVKSDLPLKNFGLSQDKEQGLPR